MMYRFYSKRERGGINRIGKELTGAMTGVEKGQLKRLMDALGEDNRLIKKEAKKQIGVTIPVAIKMYSRLKKLMPTLTKIIGRYSAVALQRKKVLNGSRQLASRLATVCLVSSGGLGRDLSNAIGSEVDELVDMDTINKRSCADTRSVGEEWLRKYEDTVLPSLSVGLSEGCEDLQEQLVELATQVVVKRKVRPAVIALPGPGGVVRGLSPVPVPAARLPAAVSPARLPARSPSPVAVPPTPLAAVVGGQAQVVDPVPAQQDFPIDVDAQPLVADDPVQFDLPVPVQVDDLLLGLGDHAREHSPSDHRGESVNIMERVHLDAVPDAAHQNLQEEEQDEYHDALEQLPRLPSPGPRRSPRLEAQAQAEKAPSFDGSSSASYHSAVSSQQSSQSTPSPPSTRSKTMGKKAESVRISPLRSAHKRPRGVSSQRVPRYYFKDDSSDEEREKMDRDMLRRGRRESEAPSSGRRGSMGQWEKSGNGKVKGVDNGDVTPRGRRSPKISRKRLAGEVGGENSGRGRESEEKEEEEVVPEPKRARRSLRRRSPIMMAGDSSSDEDEEQKERDRRYREEMMEEQRMERERMWMERAQAEREEMHRSGEGEIPMEVEQGERGDNEEMEERMDMEESGENADNGEGEAPRRH